MADLYYIEEDYYNPSLGYFVYTADAAAAVSSNFDIACDATRIGAPILVEADASLFNTVTLSAIAGTGKEAQSNITSTASVNLLITKLVEASADFTAAFSPILTVEVFKNSFAILDSVSEMSSAGVATRSANVLLEHIADLNAMAAKTVDVNSSISVVASITASISGLVLASSSIQSTSSLTVNGGKLKLAQSNQTARFTVFTSRLLGGHRPIVFNPTFVSGGKYITQGEGLSSDALGGQVKYGTHSLYRGRLTSSTLNQFSQQRTNYDFLIRANEQFSIEFWIRWNQQASGYSYSTGGFPFITHTGGTYASQVNGFNALSGTSSGGWGLGLGYESSNGHRWRFRYKNDSGTFNTLDSTVGNGSFALHAGVDTWFHIAVARGADGVIRLYKDGNQIASQTYAGAFDYYEGSSGTTANAIKVDGTYFLGGTSGGGVFIDEFSFQLGSNSILGLNSAIGNTEFHQALLHIDGNGNDDTATRLLGVAALASTATISTQANANTKSVSANLAATSSLVSSVESLKTATADLASAFTLTSVIGLRQDAISLEAGAFTFSIQETLYKDFVISVASLFTPSVSVQATKKGEITLASQFSLDVEATSFSNASADLTSAVNLTASIAGVLRLTSASITASASLTSNSGKLKTASAAITGAFNATVTARQFEGTSLIAPMTAVMTVTARKTARITRTLSSAFTSSATSRVALNNSNYPIRDRGLLHLDSTTAVDVFGGTVTSGGYTSAAGKFSNAGGYPVSAPTSITNGSTYTDLFGQNSWTVDFWFKPIDMAAGSTTWPTTGIMALTTRTPATGDLDNNTMIGWTQTGLLTGGSITGQFYIGTYYGPIVQTSNFSYAISSGVATTYKHVAVTYQKNYLAYTDDQNYLPLVIDFYNLTIKIYVDGVLAANTTEINNSTGKASSSLFLMPTVRNLTDRDTVAPYNRTRTFQGFLDEFRFTPGIVYNANFTPQTVAYNPNPFYESGDALLETRATVTAQAISVVFINSKIVVSAATLTALIGRNRVVSSNLTASSTVFARAGKQVSGAANLVSAFTQTATARRTKTATAAIVCQASVSVPGERKRFQAAVIASAFTQTSSAVKKTGIVIAIASEFSQSITSTRVRYADSNFESIASELVIAFKNATGTVLLESSFALTVAVNKTADDEQRLASEFALIANTKRFRDVDSSLKSTTAITITGDKILPAGADVSSQFTVTVNSANSKITRVSSTVNTNSSLTASTFTSRIRGGTANLTVVCTVVANNQVLRLARASLASEFGSIFVITKLVRVEANLYSQGFQLTVGDVINIDPFYQLRVPQETRRGTVLPELRTIIVTQETRVNIIQGYTL